MEQEINLNSFIRQVLEPIIDESLTSAMNKYINTINLEQPPDPSYINLKTASEYLDIPKSSIYQLIYKRSIPHYKLGSRILFRRSELSEWIKQGQIKTI